MGLSLTVTTPTGLYDSDSILNLSSNRWSFKPEIALSHPFGPGQKWEMDVYPNVYVYGDNASYRGNEVLRQEPLEGLEGHITYSFSAKLWASVDTRYSFHGTTFLNDVAQNNAQQNFTPGCEMNVSLDSRNSLIFEFAKAVIHNNGPAMTGFSVRYEYAWRNAHR